MMCYLLLSGTTCDKLVLRMKQTNREYWSTVTRKGQVTIPAEIRKSLNISEGDKVAVLLAANHQVLLKRMGSVVERTTGAAKNNRPHMSAEDLRKAAELAISQDTVERGS